MSNKIILHNWTQREDTAGGVETRMEYLNKIFPNSILSSVKNDMSGEPHDLVIRDAACKIDSNKPQITIFGNPYATLSEHFNSKSYLHYSNLRINTKDTIKVANSKFMKEDMKKIGLIPDYIIPNCVDINFWKPLNKKKKLRKKYHIPINKKVGIFVGNKIRVKNWNMIENVMDKCNNIYWIIAKKKDNKNKLEMRELYNCADFFILTSPIEGCNNSIFEALSCGLPCIVSNTGYFYKMSSKFEGGLVIPHNSLEMHLESIKKINRIKNIPRDFIIKNKLDLNSYKEKWSVLINDIR